MIQSIAKLVKLGGSKYATDDGEADSHVSHDLSRIASAKTVVAFHMFSVLEQRSF